MENRRQFVLGLAGFAGMFAVGGIGCVMRSDDLLRPPGGQDETRFLSDCTKCNRCRSICPEDVIVTATLEDGLAEMRTPKLEFRHGYCTLCGLCADVCPTGSIIAFDPETVRIGVAVINRDECIAYGQGGCTRCFDSCPFGAIALDSGNHPVIDEDVCNGCGLCEYLCPSSSYGAYDGSRSRGVNIEVNGRRS